MTEQSIALAHQVGKVEGKLDVLDAKVDGLDVRLAVLEAVAITPARLAAILAAVGVAASLVFGGITAAAVLFR